MRLREWWIGTALAGPAALLCYAFGLDAYFGDESLIIAPAIDHMRGVFGTDVMYPSFPFWFYGSFFWLAGTLDSPEGSLAAARVVNAALFGLFTALSYRLLREITPLGHALLGIAMLITMPVITSSAFLVKTENLLLVELVVGLLAIRRIEETPGPLRWHVLAAVCAGLSISTKLNPFAGLLYALQWARLWRMQRTPPLMNAGAFALIFLTVVLATWTNLWSFDEIARGWTTTPYWQPNAAPFRAVDEWLAFPYGRYSSFFSVSLPLGLGWPLLALFAVGLGMRTQDSWTRDVVGLGSLLYLAVALHGTLLRIPFSFMVLFLYPVMVVATLGPRLRRWAAVTTAICALYGFWCFTDVSRAGNIGELLSARIEPYTEAGSHLSLVQPRSSEPEPRSIRERIEAEHPAVLSVFSSYFENQCKYRNNPLYLDNCAYYGELLRNEAGYEVVDEIPYPIPGGRLHFDSEIRDATFYVLRRNEG